MKGFTEFKYPFIILVLLLINVVLIMWSCGNKTYNLQDTTLPSDNPRNLERYNPSIPILATAIHQNQIVSGIGMLGLFEIQVFPEQLNADLEHIKTGSSLSEPFTGDITEFMRINPCSDCLRITDVEITHEQTLRIHFNISHPVQLPVQDTSISEQRLDLHLFDLAGIVFTSETGSGITSFPSLSAQTSVLEQETLSIDNSSLHLLNDWDGYTSDYNHMVKRFVKTRANLHPYKIFSFDPNRGNVNPYSASGFNDIRNPSGHNIFPQGASIETFLDFNIEQGDSFTFFLALTASYGLAALSNNNHPALRMSPRYFIPEFNRKNAWRTKVNIPEETDSLFAYDTTSSTILELSVWDWQHSYGYPMSEIEHGTSRLDALRTPSGVAACIVDLPGVSDLYIVTNPIYGSGIGNDPLVYRLVVHNSKAAPEGEYIGVIGVVDELHGIVLETLNLEADILTTFNLTDFITYVPFSVKVKEQGKVS